MGRKLFTLLELVVVIAIIAITTTLAVSAFRGESPVQKMNSAALGNFVLTTKHTVDNGVYFSPSLPSKSFNPKLCPNDGNVSGDASK